MDKKKKSSLETGALIGKLVLMAWNKWDLHMFSNA